MACICIAIYLVPKDPKAYKFTQSSRIFISIFNTLFLSQLVYVSPLIFLNVNFIPSLKLSLRSVCCFYCNFNFSYYYFIICPLICVFIFMF